MTTTRKFAPRPIGERAGLRWATSRSGSARICLQRVRHSGEGWGVWVFDGSDAPHREVFASEDAAKAAANLAWGTR